MIETPTRTPTAPPAFADVLVVGAGPAGSACAQLLARQGLRTVLVDQHDFPREKVCGDGLIPDSHAAFRRLGVYDEVAASAQPVQHVRCVGARGGHVDVPGTMSVLPRRQLDHILVRAAQQAGAELHTPLRFEAPLVEGERVVGARLQGPEGQPPVEVRASWVVLATGAVPQALTAAGLCDRRTPTGTAVRAYVRHAELAREITQLQVIWHGRLRGGYGWVFPGPDGVFNIGTGVIGSHSLEGGKGRRRGRNLREMFEDFCEVYPPAARLMREGEVLGPLKGAPLRCSLRGVSGEHWGRPGLLVAGDAAGTTYAFSGEGIGKAMESGMLAAEALLHARTQTPAQADAQVLQAYAAALRQLQPQFVLYERAGIVNDWPWLADLLIWRARKSPRILRRMAGVLDETQNPARLFTLSGVTKLLFE
ncbi:NAD(P)/FAD-dependent oxidoreductase [Rubrivivax rivuli]|uniref:NAD(P)/FAD-dependent oxidoreductase n=1 Tax=Rubrivivax rivuli TaxID=1862385 RepID=UPI001FE17426|nr:NAD(P)/FAD-dependent oxidoreductase [Rubrivivax rivuli]